MTVWVIKDSDGNITNEGIKGSEEFIQANFEHYEIKVTAVSDLAEPSVEIKARVWRDMELSSTDFIVPLSDHPSRTATMTYRAALRAWPSTSDFPGTQPKLGE